MATLNRYTVIALAAVSAATSPIHNLYAQEAKEPDPWFTQEHERPSDQDEAKSTVLGQKAKDEPTVVLKRNKPAALVRELQKTLAATPDANLQKRIALLEEIVSTAKPKPANIAQLEALRKLRTEAIQAISIAGEETHSLSSSIESLAPYSQYFKGDAALLVELLGSDFATRLSSQASTWGRRGNTVELAQLETQLQNAGLKTIFGDRVSQSVRGATSSMIARRLEDLSNSADQLPGEAYLMARMLKQDSGKLHLAVNLPAGADRRLVSNVSRSIANKWGDHIQITSYDNRTVRPELVLNIDANSITTSNTKKESQVSSYIAGAVVEKENPDFIALSKRYEKAAQAYQADLRSYEARYKDYIDQLDDVEYKQAQNDLRIAKSILKATPPPSGPGAHPEWDAALEKVEFAETLANSISAPMAIKPQEPYPHHLKILDELYLVPSTIIESEEETPYEYTKQDINFTFETSAPVTLEIPLAGDVTTQETVSINQTRKWSKNIGVNPRDPQTTEGTYSEAEYESALDLFGLEFGSTCAQKLGPLLQSAEQKLESQTDGSSLPESLLLLAIQEITNDGEQVELSQSELHTLAEIAKDPNVQPKAFRAKCLATFLAKTRFSHLANENEIEKLL